MTNDHHSVLAHEKALALSIHNKLWDDGDWAWWKAHAHAYLENYNLSFPRKLQT
jgi:hypothetical protein